MKTDSNKSETVSEAKSEATLAAPSGSALDATSMSANGQYLVTLGEALQAGATDFAKHQGRLRATLDAVAKILAESADSWKRTAEGLRYDESRGVRHALDVHVNLLRDLSRELSNPGSTKYAPNAELTDRRRA